MNHAPQIVTLVSLILLSGAPAPAVDAAEPVIETAAVNRAIEVQDRHQEELFEKPGVIGVGVTYRGDQVALLVLVEEGAPRPELTASIEAIPLVVKESAPIVPINGGDGCAGYGSDPRGEPGVGCHVTYEPLPAPMGVTTGPVCPENAEPFEGPRGTTGFVACHPASRTRGYVTANHVAASENGCPNADPGLLQYYQAPYDVGCAAEPDPEAFIGTLMDRVLIEYEPHPYSLVDAAFVASTEAETSSYTLDVGHLNNVAPAILGRCVAKSGRRTGLTYGRITDVHVDHFVNYGTCGRAFFRDDFRIAPDEDCGVCEDPDPYGDCLAFGKLGDSGAAVLYPSTNELVGMLYTGVDGATGEGLAHLADNVLNALDLSLDLSLCDPPTITVNQPRAGDVWAVGATEDIYWASSNPTAVGDVRIELVRSGGGWETLFAETDNDGIESWPVTGPGTAAAQVRISSVADPAISATSDWFAIAAISVLEPNGAEAWLLGEQETIRWTGDGVVGEVAIELSRDGGGWEDIGLTPTSNDGIQEWPVTGSESSEALIRVRSVELGSVSDTSDDYFTISANLVVDSTGDGADGDLSDGICRAAGGYCTLRAAIEQANAMPGLQNVSFELPGVGVPTIAPNSPLPAISDPIVIAGTSQPGSGKVEIDGTLAGSTAGLVVTGGGSTLRGLVINRFQGKGIVLKTLDGNVVEGNLIGTDPSGTVDLGNSAHGVVINNSSWNVIGGIDEGTGNVISGNGYAGIRIQGASANTSVLGNFIGTDAGGAAALGNSGSGLSIRPEGGPTWVEGNVIAHNAADGVTVETATGVAILHNSIRDNGDLGIDLDDDGLTPNDPGDTDTGANNLQNFPLITRVKENVVSGMLETNQLAWELSEYLIQLFANDSCDAGGYGEGGLFLAETVITLDATGFGSFDIELPEPLPPAGTFITATASRLLTGQLPAPAETSELSGCYELIY